MAASQKEVSPMKKADRLKDPWASWDKRLFYLMTRPIHQTFRIKGRQVTRVHYNY